ncbi:hypothetical protein V7075_12090 [Neobacillus drentensis]|uniref:hypothetical protein n=1 Tax=Neobacillus drentensis TaxID=220684 RepID=UPI002FFDF970
MKAEAYILGLFTFEDEDEENIVFKNFELDTINANIEKHLGFKRTIQDSKWVTYHFTNKEILQSSTCKITEAEMGYYHHRVIFRFIIDGDKINTELRDIRENLKAFAQNVIQNSIIEPNRSFKFKDFDIYQLLIIHEGIKISTKKEDPVFSNDTTTMAFDITEPRKISPFGRKYNIRISIPSTIIYSKFGVSDDFLKAMINSIYQYCLYEKKELNKHKRISDIGEGQLVKLWHHIIDTMGGRTLDKNLAKVSHTNYVVAVIALAIGAVAFDLEKVFANWKLFASGFKNFANLIFSIIH